MDPRASHSFKHQVAQQPQQHSQQPQHHRHQSRKLSGDRFPPIPPSPYSSQSSVSRQEHHNDPFFPRRPPFEGHAQSPTAAERPSTYSFPAPSSYAPPKAYGATAHSGVNEPEPRRGSLGGGPAYGHTRREDYDNRVEDGRFHFDVPFFSYDPTDTCLDLNIPSCLAFLSRCIGAQDSSSMLHHSAERPLQLLPTPLGLDLDWERMGHGTIS